MPVTDPIATFALDEGGYVDSDNVLPAPSNRITHDNVEYRFLNAAVTGAGEITVRFSPVVTTRRSGIGYFSVASSGVHPTLEGAARFTPVDGPSTGSDMAWADVQGLIFTESAYPAPALNFNTDNLIDTWEGAEIGDPDDQIAVFPLDRDDLSTMTDEVLLTLSRFEREFATTGDGFARVRGASVRAAGDTTPTEWTVEDAYAAGEDTSAIARLRIGLQLIYVPSVTNPARARNPNYWGLEGAAVCVEDASNVTLLDTVLPAASEGVLDAATGVWTFVLDAESTVEADTALTGGAIQIGEPPAAPYRSVFAFSFDMDEWVLDDINTPSDLIKVGDLPEILGGRLLPGRGGSTFGATSDGNRVYLASDSFNQVRIYRLNNPGRPGGFTDLGIFSDLRHPGAIAVFDDFLYLWQGVSPHLRRIPMPVSGQTFQSVGNAPDPAGSSGQPEGMAEHYGSLYFLHAGVNAIPHLWRMDRPINPSTAVDLGAVAGATANGYGNMNSVFSHDGELYVAGYDAVWRVPDVTDATTAVRVGGWPNAFGSLISATSHPFARPPDFVDIDIPDQEYVAGSTVGHVLPEANNGFGGKSYTLTPDLPSGLFFNPSLRRIEGEPTTPIEPEEYTYTSTDAANRSESTTFDLSVVANLVPTLSSILDASGMVGEFVSVQLPAATSGNPPIMYTVG